MLSYQHGYHAGNHADILKHLCWLAVINRLKQKNKPFNLIDTHGGSGCYRLDSAQANKTGEYKDGILKLDQFSPQDPLLIDYLSSLAVYRNHNEYPGSPVLAADLLRDNDSLHVMELHPGEFDNLKANLKQHNGAGHVHSHFRDGLEGLVALSPPKPNRGAVLIDPPYESRSEYQAVVKAVKDCLKRWPQAQILIWYPLLSDRAGDKQGEAEAMCQRLAELNHDVLQVELLAEDKAADTGMYGSGVCFINPAWQVDNILDASLTELSPRLGTQCQYNVAWLNKLES
ncbi:23S rRNA (adenine(2030)-N(6))-methyltransferase RlmJ [Alteromonas lipolytica]|uniref:Ribosomal RNA large subunit methyltransferase J n=1 Tax=Alteromonas lipolytica TaxID=1856405 RepID=A0A1E8FGV5_9ALTE|nr:23S rRNA (adenine(2030)-N(6))-methyltransferase RlmJ [Alteromonas lipolytica]OFI35144.1 hypothetical protein BFC17_16500 [Alteromonas lipolytica]GGF57056.1 ribosomal RNA large subunit methyltransferase J [Alteromonas lipolytica]